jgi:hypothetical protein
MNRKVNFLILGTQKAGTTSLYEYIKQHNDIYFSDVKEVTYFSQSKLYKKGEDYYHSFFSKVNNEKIIASAYVHMLPCSECIQRVKKYNPNMKFVIMLRDPIDRAYSAYNYALKNGWENKNNSFEDSIKLELNRVKNEKYDLMYFENGLYHKHIKGWQKHFPKEKFLLIKDTDLRDNVNDVLNEIFVFLELKKTNSINTSKEFNKAGVVHSKILQAFLLKKNSVSKKIIGFLFPRSIKVWIRANILKYIYKFNQADKKNIEMSIATRENLKKYFKNDLSRLENEFNIKF